MAEELNCGIHRTLQNEQHNNTFRRDRKNDNLARISSSNTNYYHLGCLGSSLDLRFSTFKEDEIEGADRLFDEQPRTPGGKFRNNSTGSKDATINCEYNVLKRDLETKRNNCAIHDGCVNSLSGADGHTVSTIESTKNADVKMGSRCERCPNQRGLEILQAQFGELFGVGALAGDDTWTDEIPSKTCRLVYAYSPSTQEGLSNESPGNMPPLRVCERQTCSSSGSNNSSILVDKFEKSVRFKIADFIGCKDLIDSEPEELNYYIADVAEFGFDHIIFIGEVKYGMVFLDCYGRVFLWEDMSRMLYPLADSLEEVLERPVEDIAWIVKNGIVYEYFKEPQPIYADTEGEKK